MEKLIEFLDELDNRDIYYRLNKIRDSILVEISVPGQRWEAEFFCDGSVEVQKYVSDGNILDEREFETLFRDFSD